MIFFWGHSVDVQTILGAALSLILAKAAKKTNNLKLSRCVQHTISDAVVIKCISQNVQHFLPLTYTANNQNMHATAVHCFYDIPFRLTHLSKKTMQTVSNSVVLVNNNWNENLR